MSASDHLNTAQFGANDLEYTPRSYTHLDMLKGANNEPMVSGWHPPHYRTGFADANHEIEATHPEHGVVGKAKWTDDGNIYVKVEPQFQSRGIGMRLVDEAHKYDPAVALQGLTPVTHSGQRLAAKVGKKYGVPY